jgi:hypothetical protein
VPRHLHNSLTVVVAGLLIAIPTESVAQRYGGHSHSGGWHGGGGRGHHGGYRSGHYGNRTYGGYSGYYGYGGYPRYYGYGGYGYPGYYGYGGYYGHHHDNDGVWIALGAGLFGLILGSALARPRVVYQYAYPSEAPPPPPPPAAPVTPRCQDGSPVPAGGYCTGPQAEPPPPPPMGERG